MSKKLIECPKCDGAGEWDEPHPLWGCRSCPEAYVQVICPRCDGKGECEPDEDDELSAKEMYDDDKSLECEHWGGDWLECKL